MKIESLCKRELVAVNAQATIRAAATLMCEAHVGALAVLSGEDPPTVVGMVTDRDLTLEVLGRPELAGDLQVGAIAKGPVRAIPKDADVGDAIDAMADAGVRRLLVVDAEGTVIGLVSADDLLEALALQFSGLATSLAAGATREASERHVFRAPARMRVAFPAIGTLAGQ